MKRAAGAIQWSEVEQPHGLLVADRIEDPRRAPGDHAMIPGMTVAHRDALAALDRAYGGVGQLAAGLTTADLLAFSRCRGWTVVDVLFHLLCDAQRALVTLASPAPGPPDRDYVSYWADFAASADDPAPALWIRRSAAAFRDGTGVVALWHETAPAAVRAAQRAEPDGFLTTQGHVLAVPDFLATLVTEAAIHHLDMVVHLPGAPGPHPDAVALAARTLDGLLAADRPVTWTMDEYLLKGTGRLALSDEDRSALGEAAQRFPLLS